MPKENNTITKDMLIGELIKRHPRSVEIMMEHGMQCVGCHVATWETIEQGAKGHGINVNELIKELNNQLGEVK